MALKINTVEEVASHIVATETIWANADYTKVVDGDSPEAAFLVATKGKRIPKDLAERLGLVDAAKSGKAPTVEEVLAEVGEDKDKATAALEAEQAQKKPRKSLVKALEGIIGGGE